MLIIHFKRITSEWILLLFIQAVLSAEIPSSVKSQSMVSPYNYENVSAWGNLFPTCMGQQQSPIALNKDTIFYTERTPLRWIGYDNQPTEMTLGNNGHTVKLIGKWKNGNVPYISGGPLLDDYVFGQIHFHWGPNDTYGAEHTMHGFTFPLEMHMVHYKRPYGSIGNALKHVDGLAVVGILFTITNQTVVTTLDPVTDYLTYVSKPHTVSNIAPFRLSILGGIYSPMAFMSYSGSLTTPPCNEVVIWIVPIYAWPATSKQLSQLRSLQLQTHTRYNNRPLQPLNGRHVYFYKT
ncbi:hypothetical protein HCN44_010225 [Aphidius gifuensis]|uniref:carbonic anhydrase n=1 Tax=Aphidius gifuensis TaxID=684658 RepID=A0A834XUD6_APHGI|nr:carbonic anhydrase 1-like [Aphidius gifuensis]KAF7993630.1 hypothetical protein HCN44_010225 [Aphidius gifuensis]